SEVLPCVGGYNAKTKKCSSLVETFGSQYTPPGGMGGLGKALVQDTAQVVALGDALQGKGTISQSAEVAANKLAAGQGRVNKIWKKIRGAMAKSSGTDP